MTFAGRELVSILGHLALDLMDGTRRWGPTQCLRFSPKVCKWFLSSLKTLPYQDHIESLHGSVFEYTIRCAFLGQVSGIISISYKPSSGFLQPVFYIEHTRIMLNISFTLSFLIYSVTEIGRPGIQTAAENITRHHL